MKVILLKVTTKHTPLFTTHTPPPDRFSGHSTRSSGSKTDIIQILNSI